MTNNISRILPNEPHAARMSKNTPFKPRAPISSYLDIVASVGFRLELPALAYRYRCADILRSERALPVYSRLDFAPLDSSSQITDNCN